MKLGELIAKALGRDFSQVGVYGRKGMVGERTKEEIGMQVIRAGDIVGEHTVLFGGIGERLEVIHRAHSRDNFARGAVRAALWVVSQPNGLYKNFCSLACQLKQINFRMKCMPATRVVNKNGMTPKRVNLFNVSAEVDLTSKPTTILMIAPLAFASKISEAIR